LNVKYNNDLPPFYGPKNSTQTKQVIMKNTSGG